MGNPSCNNINKEAIMIIGIERIKKNKDSNLSITFFIKKFVP